MFFNKKRKGGVMAKKSFTKILNSIYADSRRASEEAWQELFDACKTFHHFKEAHYCAEDINNK